MVQHYGGDCGVQKPDFMLVLELWSPTPVVERTNYVGYHLQNAYFKHKQEHVWTPYFRDIINAIYFIFNTDDVILNRSCAVKCVGASYVKSLYKTEP